MLTILLRVAILRNYILERIALYQGCIRRGIITWVFLAQVNQYFWYFLSNKILTNCNFALKSNNPLLKLLKQLIETKVRRIGVPQSFTGVTVYMQNVVIKTRCAIPICC